MIKAILATGLNGEIGQNGDMPWGRSLPKDLEYFKKVTFNQKVVMGRKTFESLPFKNGLPKRVNYVLTSEPFDLGYKNSAEYLYRINSGRLDLILTFGKNNNEDDHSYWLIGGASIYEQFWEYVTEVHITTVHNTYSEADTFFKPDLSNFEMVGEEINVGNGELEASVQVWRRV